jgi:outer membrane protein TolC
MKQRNFSRLHRISPATPLTALLSAALLFGAAGIIGSEELSLGDIVGAVVENDTSLEIARETVTNAYNRYRLAKAPGSPQISINTNPIYGMSLRRDYDFESFSDFDISDPESFGLQRRTTLSHSWNAGVEFSQLLPTGGNVSVSLQDTVNYNYLYPENDDESDEASYWSQAPQLNLNVTQPIFVNGRFLDSKLFTASTRIAEIGWEKSRENERAITNNVLTGAASLYIQLLSFQRSIDFTRTRLDIAQRQLRQAQIDAEQGRASQNQVLGLEVAVNRTRENLLDLQFSRLQAERDLASLLGMEEIGVSEVNDDFSDYGERIAALLGESSALPEANETLNPELKSRLLDLEQAQWQARVNGRDSAPRVGLNFSIAPRYRDDRAVQAGTGTFGSSVTDFFEGENPGVNFSLGLQVNVPITDGGQRKAQRDADESAQRLAQLDVKKTRDDIQDRIYLARERDLILQQRRELVELNTTYQRNRLERERRLAEVRSATQLEVDLINLEYIAARNTLWQTEADIFLNRLQLLSLYGYEVKSLFD